MHIFEKGQYLSKRVVGLSLKFKLGPISKELNLTTLSPLASFLTGTQGHHLTYLLLSPNSLQVCVNDGQVLVFRASKYIVRCPALEGSWPFLEHYLVKAKIYGNLERKGVIG